MKQYQKLIFVCTENTCRSMMAETIFNSIEKAPVKACSRGLVVLFPEPMNPKAVAVLKSHQLECKKECSEPLCAEDIEPDTLILTMTEREVVGVKECLPEEEYDVSTIRAFTGQKGDVAEPHGALTEYGVLYEHIDLLVKMIAEILLKG